LHYKERKELEETRNTLQKHLNLLDTFAKDAAPSSISAKHWMETSETLARESNRLQKKLDTIALKTQRLDSLLKNECDASEPVALAEPCKGRLRLTLPAQAVRFDASYRADLNKGRMAITQVLEVTNRSGIDINATEAHFFNERASKYVALPHFSPVILHDKPPVVMKKTRTLAMQAAPLPVSPLLLLRAGCLLLWVTVSRFWPLIDILLS
jgi:hypothetical protein